MDVQQLRARVAQLEEAIDKGKIESAQATQQLEVETDEGVLVSLWAKITARRNAGKTLVEQLAAARAELLSAEQAAALERHKAAVKAYEAAYKDMAKAAAAAFALAEKASAALELVVETQEPAGIKRKSLATMRGGNADPYAVLCESLGFEILAPWNAFEVRRPQAGIPQTPNPFALHLSRGG
jgi:hypothetical protein